ncbi:MAG TPA: choice-of-anchor Q domain-containing protein [Byssovorax sp.]|jgi:hypothetical protein
MRNLGRCAIGLAVAAAIAACGGDDGATTGGEGGAGGPSHPATTSAGGSGPTTTGTHTTTTTTTTTTTMSASTSTSSSSGGGGGGVAPSNAALSIFFTDLTSGPNTGGEDGSGAYVTIYGAGFGDAQGTSTVTVGGGAVSGYPIWSDKKITVQLGAQAATGDVVVHVPTKGDSNGQPFTVRAGNLFFVTSSGDDQADGSFAHPWQTIPKAKNAVQPGDVAYVGVAAGDAVSQTDEDSSSPYNCALGMSKNDGANSGTADLPKALVAYPGAIATVGVESGLERGLLTPAITGTFDYWVVAGIRFRGAVEAVDWEGAATGWRFIGNDMSCPNGTGLSGCVNGIPDHIKYYGNVVHDAAANVADGQITKYYHGIYFGGSNHIEIGWSVVENGKTCRGIQFHDSGGVDNFDLIVHDTIIHDTVCDGLNFATVDPSQGPIEAYNNLIYDTGLGPDPADGSSDYAGIYIANITNAGAPGQGKVKVYNNTLFSNGTRGTSAAGQIACAPGTVGVELVDNVVVAASGGAYFSGDTDASLVSGSNNLFYGAGGPPPAVTASVLGDPMFANAATFDLHLQAGSPAIDAGVATSAATDFDGVPRPQGGDFDIGAYELVP